MLSRLFVVVAFALSVGGCRCQQRSADVVDAGVAQAPLEKKCTPKVLVALEGTPKVDGELDEPVWHSAAATEPFVHATANQVVPHTEARAAWDREALYVVVYAADADLRSNDQIFVAFNGGGVIAANPAGVVSCRFGGQELCAPLGVVASVDRDGDVDANNEEDEEWIVELKIPWKLLGSDRPPERVGVNFSRLETLEGKRIREVWSRECGEIQLQVSDH